MRARLSLIGGAGALALVSGLVGAVPAAVAAEPTTPFVSEFHYDNNGGDTGEFVEVQIPAGSSSAGLSVVLYNGGGTPAGATYRTDALPLVTAPADSPAVAVIDYPVDGIQNGSPDGIALVGAAGVIELLSYEGTLTASNGPAAGRTSVDIGVAESGTECRRAELEQDEGRGRHVRLERTGREHQGSAELAADPARGPGTDGDLDDAGRRRDERVDIREPRGHLLRAGDPQ